MRSIHILCPLVLPLKDLLTACREIEDFMKGSTGVQGRSNEEVMAEFLRGDGPIATEVLSSERMAWEAAAKLAAANTAIPIPPPIDATLSGG